MGNHFIPRRIGKKFKVSQCKFLSRMCKNENSLFLEVESGKRSLENNLALSCKAGHVHVLQLGNSIPKPEKFLLVCIKKHVEKYA